MLSPEIRYENFENRPDFKSARKLPTASMNVGKEGERRSDRCDGIDQTPTPIPRLYKPTTLTARDIHTEIPSVVPEQSKHVDVKVGTDNVLHFPVSVQTDTVLPREDQPPSPQPRYPSVQTTRLSVQTKEFSIQTEPDVKNVPVTSVMRDVAINTENVEKEDENKFVSILVIGVLVTGHL